MRDIVEKLRAFADRERPYGQLPDALEEAANEIERLRAALREIAERKTYSETAAAISAAAIARAALDYREMEDRNA